MRRGRGRRSPNVVEVEFRRPPKAPVGLNPVERDVWCGVTSRKPVDWWSPESLEALREYCRACSDSDMLHRVGKALGPDTLKTPEGLKRYAVVQGWIRTNTNKMLRLAEVLRVLPGQRKDLKFKPKPTKRK